jgi:Family of unknown function (DUF5709)
VTTPTSKNGGVDLDDGVLDPEGSLVDCGVLNVPDEGCTPPEHPCAVLDWGLTAREAAGHEDLGERLAREVPDVSPVIDQGDGLGDASDSDGDLSEDQGSGAGRTAGRGPDADEVHPCLFASDAGVDGGAASAEEAAVHVVAE